MIEISGATIEEYDEAIRLGEPAEAEVFGTLRGGWYYDGNFFYTMGRFMNKAKGHKEVRVLQ